ncbi:hypothetical protein V9T40_006184 [Parthenolecanium corni]|uniref:ADP-ribosylhydrolase ARH3 n=1 Tax=Parthenolecanium corni TaxID=536013 RepID=A0AAN9Y9B2_9HEMI
MLAKKFRGCLIGALSGDCFGAPYEDEPVSAISKTQLQTYFDNLEGPPFKTPQYRYTDDTAMTKCVAESLIAHNAFNAYDMAERFVKEYYVDPNRGYGANVTDVFGKLNIQNLENVWKPAEEQFGGSGSYGNGGAMRVAPVPLFAHKNYDLMLDIAEKSTRLTHTHPLGVNGALLQTLAIYLCLKRNPETPLDIAEYTKELIDKISIIESQSNRVVSDQVSYRGQLLKLQTLLELGDNVVPYQIAEELGTDVSAVFSVPTAIYCFLRAQNPVPDINTSSPFRRTIQLAISLGGDTDTIASMSGAIAGAYYGIDSISQNLQNLAEGREIIDSLAMKLYNQVTN